MQSAYSESLQIEIIKASFSFSAYYINLEQMTLLTQNATLLISLMVFYPFGIKGSVAMEYKDF